MSQYSGFDTDVSTMNDIATKELPDVVTSINSEASMIYSLGLTADRGAGSQPTDNSGALFSNSTVPTQLGAKYNELVQDVYEGLSALGGSMSTAADRLKKIADNYERIDQSLAGQ
jgi:type VII secretion effector (TIGR04197 family)